MFQVIFAKSLFALWIVFEIVIAKTYKKKSESESLSKGKSIISQYCYSVSTDNLTGVII